MKLEWLFVLAVSLAVSAAAPALAQSGRVSRVVGTVEIALGDPPLWRTASEGESLSPGAAIRTGPRARAELVLPRGTVRLYENSLLRLPPGPANGDTRVLELERGGSLFDVDPDMNRDGFEVRTPEAVVVVKGTRFLVDLTGGAAAVAVFRGLVGVRGPLAAVADEVLVRPGFIAMGGNERSFELRLERMPDPWSSWEMRHPHALPRDAESDAGPAKRQALSDARFAALDSARTEVMERALERRPELRAAVRRLSKRNDKHSRGRGQRSDPISDLGDSEAMESIEQEIVEGVLNAGEGSPGFVPLEISYVTSGGPNHLDFFDVISGNLVAQMSKKDVKDFLTTLNPALIPPPVMANIAASGLAAPEYMELVWQGYMD